MSRIKDSQDHLKQCCYNYMMIDTFKYLSLSMTLQTTFFEETRDLCELISEKLLFLKYVIRNVLYHADVVNDQDISQKVFLKKFALKN